MAFLRQVVLLLLLCIHCSELARAVERETCQASSAEAKICITNSASCEDTAVILHLVVLVHGYMGSYREQEYLGESLITQSKKLMSDDSNTDHDGHSCLRPHKFVMLSSKANMNRTTDGIAMGGKRLAAEVSDWIQHYAAEDDQATITLSLIGNSLGGLYARYALAELYYEQQQVFEMVLPLLFCSTSSPHLGVSQETFIELPTWIESSFATMTKQQTMLDLFQLSSVVMDMCQRGASDDTSSSNRPESFDDSKSKEKKSRDRDYLYPLGLFQKRIAIANAYNTDFLVSVSSSAFLSSESDSMHHQQTTNTPALRLMKKSEYVALQVTTDAVATGKTTIGITDNPAAEDSRSRCVDSLDQLGWHKIFIDTRSILPNWLQISTPELIPRQSYSSKDLHEQFRRHGTILPIAHPLNMANSRTDIYRKMTKRGQPIMAALAELLVLDMKEISEKK